MVLRRVPLNIAILLVCAQSTVSVASENHPHQHGADDGLHMTITADPRNRASYQLSSATEVIGQQTLFKEGANTIGDAIKSQLGVHVDQFGAGASRPVIRGQSAARVKVLLDGGQLFDASTISPDHAVTVDPLLAKRVEVLRGPSTLLYGGGAIGGVVNVVDDKIPTARPEAGSEGVFGIRTDYASLAREAVFGVTTALNDQVMLRLEGLSRYATDYRAPNQDSERVAGTATEGYAGTIGLSWVGEQGYLGIAYSKQGSEYALAGHSHEYHDCHVEDAALHCEAHDEEEHEGEHDEHEHEDEHDHEAHGLELPPTSRLRNERIELRGEWRQPLSGIERVKLRASHTNYQHQEIEEGAVSTTFSNTGHEVRVEANHVPLMGWEGTVGVQHSQFEFSALGEESFLPVTDNQNLSVFVMEHRDLHQDVHLELGGRVEQVSITPNDGQAKFDDRGISASGALLWQFLPEYTVGLTLARSQRLPNAQELYADGVHLATNTYEQGNSTLKVETANTAEVSLRKHQGTFNFEWSAYFNQANDYIYAKTQDRFEDFRLIEYTQADAEFYGTELELAYKLTPRLKATAFGDYVRGRLKAGENLPRIPATRYGVRLNQKYNAWNGELEWYQVDRAREIADFEQHTPAYQMLNLSISYTQALADETQWYSVFVRGSNLLNEEAYNHSSFLANVVPMVGRNVSMGLQMHF
jgi:iron complex outermembrane receptor protein